jgi:predicted RNA binding protein YcfA (HicA-like mRNA interferase family)
LRIPRQLSGQDVARALRILGCEGVRQEGSHHRLTTQVSGTHHVTVHNHEPLKIGPLLGSVLKPVAGHHWLTVEELLAKLSL